MDLKPYFRIEMGRPASIAESEARPLLEQTLLGVVARQLHADVPVGVMLSGGLDSSLIAAFARKVRPDLPLQAFSINTHHGMAAEGFEDDMQYAAMMAKSLGIALHDVSGYIPEISGSWIDTLVKDLDEPQADPAAWYTKMLGAAAREKGVKVLLSGTGGDDVFSGYRRHQALALFGMMHYLPKPAARLGGILQKVSPGSGLARRAGKLLSGAGLSPIRGAIHSHFWTEPSLIADLLAQPSAAISEPYGLFESLLQEIPAERNLLQQMLFLEQRTFLPQHNLAYMDKMGMAASVEIRVPFADREIVSLAAALPADMKLRGKTTKAILRDIALPYLPAEVIQRSKTGFGAPLRQWMQGPLKPLLRERLLDESFFRRGIFNPAAIGALIRENDEGRNDRAYTLFSLLCIESWLRQFAS